MCCFLTLVGILRILSISRWADPPLPVPNFLPNWTLCENVCLVRKENFFTLFTCTSKDSCYLFIKGFMNLIQIQKVSKNIWIFWTEHWFLRNDSGPWLEYLKYLNVWCKQFSITDSCSHTVILYCQLCYWKFCGNQIFPNFRVSFPPGASLRNIWLSYFATGKKIMHIWKFHKGEKTQ